MYGSGIMLNFIKLILNIYDQSEVVYVKFYQGVTSYSGVNAL